MFTVLSAIAIVGGAIPLIKKSTEGDSQKAKPKQNVDPATAALLAAKSLSLSLPQPIAAHALSKVTTPPSILVPSHTPSPPVPDIQVLAGLLAAARKHGLNRWGSQSLFVKDDEGLDMGIWIGRIEDSGSSSDETWKKSVAGSIVERLTDGKTEKKHVSELITISSSPTSTTSDAAFGQALSPLDVHIAFSLPPKDEKQAFFLVGRHKATQNWIAIGAASGSEPIVTTAKTESSVKKVDLSPESNTNEEENNGDENRDPTRGGEAERGRGRGRNHRGGRARRGRRRGLGESRPALPAEQDVQREPDTAQQQPEESRPPQQSQQRRGPNEPSRPGGEGRARGRRRRRPRARGGQDSAPVTPAARS